MGDLSAFICLPLVYLVPAKAREGDIPGNWLQMVVCNHVGVGNQTQVGPLQGQPVLSDLFSPLTVVLSTFPRGEEAFKSDSWWCWKHFRKSLWPHTLSFFSSIVDDQLPIFWHLSSRIPIGNQVGAGNQTPVFIAFWHSLWLKIRPTYDKRKPRVKSMSVIWVRKYSPAPTVTLWEVSSVSSLAAWGVYITQGSSHVTFPQAWKWRQRYMEQSYFDG